MGTNYYVEAATGNIVGAGTAAITGSVFGAAFDTNVASARLNISANLIAALGTDTNVDIDVIPKGSGSVVIPRIVASGGLIDNTVIGGVTPKAGTFTTLSSAFLDVAGAANFDNTTIGNTTSYGGGIATALATIQSVNATPQDVVSISISEDEIWHIKAKVIAEETSTPSAGRAVYELSGAFFRLAGDNVTQIGTTSVFMEEESDFSWDCDFFADITGQTVKVKVTGVAATTINWKCFYETFKVTRT